jgi:hypothetical protein
VSKHHGVDIYLYLDHGKHKLYDLTLFKLNLRAARDDLLIDFLVISRSQLYPFFKGVILG